MINLTPTLMETMAAINAQVNADAAWPDHAVKSDPIGGWLNPAAPEWDETAAAESGAVWSPPASARTASIWPSRQTAWC
jgi:hypothetical protein